MKRYYIKCLNCHHRTKRTGNKQETYEMTDQGPVPYYFLEYHCSHCGTIQCYDENTKTNYFGNLEAALKILEEYYSHIPRVEIKKDS